MTAYRFRGVNPKGQPISGRFTVASNLPALVELYYRRGWRSLLICPGDGPVPPPLDDEHKVAAIEAHPDSGKRIWWATGDKAEPAPKESNDDRD